VPTGDNISDVGTKPIDQVTLEEHLASIQLGRKFEREISQVTTSGRKGTHVVNDLARVAGILKHSGLCMVGLAAMVSRTEAAPDHEEKGPDDNMMMVWKLLGIMMMMRTLLVAAGSGWLGWYLTPKPPRREIREAGAQTEQPVQLQITEPSSTSSSWQPGISDMTINS
jgi:hypothetical protein